ncbi:MAG: hypothetical protein WD226_01695 [Planctomycetota bacterium]
MGTTSDRVLKFGGAALADAAAMRRMVELVPTRAARPVVVVSAHEGVTRALEAAWQASREGRRNWDAVRVRHRSLVRELGLSPLVVEALLRELGTVLAVFAAEKAGDRAGRDLVLSYGERLSARLVAAALRAAGHASFAADAFDLGLVVGADGLPDEASSNRVRDRLSAQPGIPVVTGFLALDREGRVVTLGPDGSDLTAVWLGRALGDVGVELFKTVRGWLTVAPEWLAGGVELASLSRVLAHELARRGANVIHPRALEVAGAGELLLVDVRAPARGTSLVDRAPAPGVPVALVAEEHPLGACITVVGGEVGVDATFAEAWTARVGDSGWIAGERSMHAFGAVVAVPDATRTLERWHAALLDWHQPAATRKSP